jgi:predicted nuclease of restriction endonuclease-like (RecB) superfamily
MRKKNQLENTAILFDKVRTVLKKARNSAHNAVNAAMVQAYWQIGRLIVEDEQGGEERAEYGKGILKELSRRLTIEFGKGYSIQTLRNIRQFYMTFPKRSALRSELTWTHYKYLMRVDNEKAREWYINEAADQNWATRQLDRQRRMRIGDEDFYVDLVFYNFILKCFVLIDLKIGKLTYQDIGQMDGYVRMYEENLRREDDNPTIGLILCSEKNEAVARYSVLKESRQLFASRYMLYLPTEDELQHELERERKLIEERERANDSFRQNYK